MNKISFTPEQLSQLKSEFDALNTVEERIDFWRERFKIRYSIWSELAFWDKANTLINQDLHDFYVKPSTNSDYKKEVERLNLLMLHEQMELDLIRVEKILINIDELKAKIDKKISGSIKPKDIVAEELKRLDELIVQNQQKEHGFGPEIHYRNSIKDAWIRGFDEYYHKENEVDYSSISSATPFIVALHNGCAIAQYKEHLKKRFKNANIKKDEETTLKQQLLMLRLSGILDYFIRIDWNQKERENFLATLLNRSPQNIKKAFTVLHSHNPKDEIWTVNNIQFLIKHLSKINKTEINKEVEKLKHELFLLNNEQDTLG